MPLGMGLELRRLELLRSVERENHLSLGVSCATFDSIRVCVCVCVFLAARPR